MAGTGEEKEGIRYGEALRLPVQTRQRFCMKPRCFRCTFLRKSCASSISA